MQKTDILIRTKLNLPFTRHGLVSRPRLQEQIVQGLRGPLTLITAPAGFGKTTLVASCVAACGVPVAWLSLDKDDNQAERFISYLIAALHNTDHAIGIEAAQLLTALPQAPVEAVLTSLINDMDSAGGEIALVLDDYQFISSLAVHEAVAFLLEHCPKAFHLLIGTRSDPPLPLARLRARGQTVELRAADLSFTEPEAAQFLNDVMGLRLDARSVAALEERTEGWIAGLQMAALSMRDREDVRGFIEGFSGTNRYILDYLLEEVLASQSLEIQRFLLWTSILERLTASLCDAVLANDEGSKREGDDRSTRSESLFLRQSASILEYLERVNLFLVPLDDERIWYRYHHLFADLLRTQLQKSLGVQDVALLHLRASEWYEQDGSTLEAIHHASIASDLERVERLIEQNYMAMAARGEMSSLRYWTGRLPKELIYSRPWLCAYEAESRSWFGELDEADRLLQEAEKSIQSATSQLDDRPLVGHLAFVRSHVSAMRGDTQRAIELALVARDNYPAENLGVQLGIGVILGYAYFLDGNFPKASETLHATIQSGSASDAVSATVGACGLLARLHAVQGRLHDAFDLLQNAGQMATKAGAQYPGAKAVVEVNIGSVLYEWNDLAAALENMERGLRSINSWGKSDLLALAYVTLCRIQHANGDWNATVDTVQKAVDLIHTRGVFPEARGAVEAAQVKLWLAQGDLQAANCWAASFDKKAFGLDDAFRFKDELTQITRARVFMVQNKLDEAIELLSHLEETARSAGRMGRVIEILLLEALALREISDSEHAILALTKCLTLAEPERYVRVFLDEGQPMQMLLTQWLAHASAGPLRDYAVRLLSAFDAEPRPPAPQEKVPPTGDLVQQLSQRELEVLHLMALGRTNQEIARQLIISRGTVKAHTANIYRKLDVANRTEAVARARDFGILP
jgi:LuxR family maltose regulon positive regulatory protein